MKEGVLSEMKSDRFGPYFRPRRQCMDKTHRFKSMRWHTSTSSSVAAGSSILQLLHVRRFCSSRTGPVVLHPAEKDSSLAKSHWQRRDGGGGRVSLVAN